MTRMPGLGLFLALGVLSPALAPAQVQYPPKPESYTLHARYRIRTDEQGRIRDYQALTADLKALGFKSVERVDADLEIFDTTADRLEGTIPAASVDRLVADPRIVSAVLLPAGMKPPADRSQPVPVRIRITGGLAPKQQSTLHGQVVERLGLLGFREGIAYDHAGHTLVRGSLPYHDLTRLLKDLRTQPAGWFAPVLPPPPLPLRAVNPIQVVEVLAESPAVPPAAPSPEVISPKLTPDLRAVVADPASLTRPLRVDAILEDIPSGAWRDVRLRLRSAAQGVSVEGLVGVVATVRLARAADVRNLANLPEVRSIRLPRAASETIRALAGEPAPKPADLIGPSQVDELHRLGYRGDGARIVIVGSGFPGWQGLVGKTLPASTKFIDLTAELTPEVEPTQSERAGGGTVAALAAHAAAPQASITLVRVEPTAFHQLETVARVVSGERPQSEAMQSRTLELTARSEELIRRREVVEEEYRRAFADLSDEAKAVKRRAAARAALEQVAADEKAFKAAVSRYTELWSAMDQLRGSGVVINTLVWETGYPQDGLSEVSRMIDVRFAPRPVASALRASKQPLAPQWVQAASLAVGQIWSGPFVDADDNGVAEFAPAGVRLAPGSWTRELNFLGLSANNKTTDALPAGLKVRFTVQWREPQDPAGFGPRDANFPLTLRLLRQIDPEGKTVASDELVEVARSGSHPVRLLKTAGSAAFEQTLEVTIPADGIYALRLEGRPTFEHLVMAGRTRPEMSPRLVVQSTDAGSAARGRVVFRTFSTLSGGVGIPGDAASAITIGVAGNEINTLTGTGPGVTLRAKPELFGPGAAAIENAGGEGSGVAAGFAGGTAASLLSAGARLPDLVERISQSTNRVLVLPADWLKALEPAK